jgi:hypothetical protein
MGQPGNQAHNNLGTKLGARVHGAVEVGLLHSAYARQSVCPSVARFERRKMSSWA